MRSTLSRPSVRIGLVVVLLALVAGAAAVVYMQVTAFSYPDLLTTLRAQGATVRESGTASTLTFTGVGHGLTIDGADVAAYEYATSVAARIDAARVSADGATFRGGFGPFGGKAATVEWIAPPHHFRRGRVIVTYIGSDASVLRLLSNVLGPQFSGGTPPSGADTGYLALLARLRAAGATFEVVSHRPGVAVIYSTQPATDANELRLNGALVSVYQFADEQAAAGYASHLSGGDYVDGRTGILVDYFAPPHFYRAHALLVEYVGADPRILQTLASVLGPPFTQGHA